MLGVRQLRHFQNTHCWKDVTSREIRSASKIGDDGVWELMSLLVKTTYKLWSFLLYFCLIFSHTQSQTARTFTLTFFCKAFPSKSDQDRLFSRVICDKHATLYQVSEQTRELRRKYITDNSKGKDYPWLKDAEVVFTERCAEVCRNERAAKRLSTAGRRELVCTEDGTSWQT